MFIFNVFVSKVMKMQCVKRYPDNRLIFYKSVTDNLLKKMRTWWNEYFCCTRYDCFCIPVVEKGSVALFCVSTVLV